MQTNDQKTGIEDVIIQKLYELGKIRNSNVFKPSKFDWERCSRISSYDVLHVLGTDKGVSAKQIVVSGKMLDYDDEFSPSMHNDTAVKQLNSVLPDDIRAFSCIMR